MIPTVRRNTMIAKSQLCQRLDVDFGNLSLGHGLSIRQALGRDSGISERESRIARLRDEVDDWRRLIDSELLSTQAFCFMDARGVLFHLPACFASLLLVEEPERRSRILDVVLFLFGSCSGSQLDGLSNVQLRLSLDILQYLRLKVNQEHQQELDLCIKRTQIRIAASDEGVRI